MNTIEENQKAEFEAQRNWIAIMIEHEVSQGEITNQEEMIASIKEHIEIAVRSYRASLAEQFNGNMDDLLELLK